MHIPKTNNMRFISAPMASDDDFRRLSFRRFPCDSGEIIELVRTDACCVDSTISSQRLLCKQQQIREMSVWHVNRPEENHPENSTESEVLKTRKEAKITQFLCQHLCSDFSLKLKTTQANAALQNSHCVINCLRYSLDECINANSFKHTV